jgi:hypothetical protein
VLDTWDILGPADVLDLDWSPTKIVLAFELAGLDATPLRRAFDGDALVNPHYASEITVWGSVTALDPPAVREVSAALQRVLPRAVWESVPADEAEAKNALNMPRIVGHPTPYLARHLRALRIFYAEAAAAGLAVIQWWD